MVHAARVATEFRQKFQKDAVIDIFCYRRFGHNEGDEPMFTNPIMYKKIKGHKTTLSLVHRPAGQGWADPRGRDRGHESRLPGHLNEEFEAGKVFKPNKADWLDGRWSHLDKEGDKYQRGKTAIKKKTLEEIGKTLTTVPEGFPLHKTVERSSGCQARDVRDRQGLRLGHGRGAGLWVASA